MAEKVLLPTAKKAVYNGTHGNLSALIGSASLTAEPSNKVVLAKLDVGVKLVRVVFANSAFGAGVTAKLQLVGDSETVDVTGDIDASVEAVTNSDDAGWFPAKLNQEKHELVIALSGGSVAGKEIKYRIETISEGNL